MKKIVFFFLLLINIYADESLGTVLDKIKYALNCNAKFTSISEVEINDYKLKKKTNSYKIYEFYGTYKSVLSGSFHFRGFGIGDEFHPISGIFRAIVKETDKGLILEDVFYKISFKKGHVIKQCLLGDE